MSSTIRYWCPLHDVTHGPYEFCPECRRVMEAGAPKLEQPPTGVLAACAGQVLDVLSKIVHDEYRPDAERIAAADVILRWYKP